MTGIEFFSKAIKENEVDSMLITDSTELLEMKITEKNADSNNAVEEKTIEEYKIIALEKKIAAWLVLFAKYTNAREYIV